MARSIRIEYPGAYYHVLARGNRREAIFQDDVDRRYFLKVLSEIWGQATFIDNLQLTRGGRLVSARLLLAGLGSGDIF